jgi:hypothetical protein
MCVFIMAALVHQQMSPKKMQLLIFLYFWANSGATSAGVSADILSRLQVLDAGMVTHLPDDIWAHFGDFLRGLCTMDVPMVVEKLARFHDGVGKEASGAHVAADTPHQLLFPLSVAFAVVFFCRTQSHPLRFGCNQIFAVRTVSSEVALHVVYYLSNNVVAVLYRMHLE